MPIHHASDASPSSSIAATLALAASHGPRAILVGNRAGVVEWANAAWTRITGFPLADTIHKPISHFLQVAAIEIELVEFVAQNFVEGQPTTIVFPFETFDQRKLTIQLEVESIRNAFGEIDQFVATATDVSGRRVESPGEDANSTAGPNVAGATSRTDGPTQPIAPRRSEPNPTSEGLTSVSLSHEIDLAAAPFVRVAGSRSHFDFDTRFQPISIDANPVLLRETLHQLFVAATRTIDESWGFVSASAGVTEIGRGFDSCVHPVIARPARLATAAYCYVEIHDTQETLSDEELRAIRDGTLRASPRARALTTASALAQAMGGELYLDSTPGCGTQALLLIPLREVSGQTARKSLPAQ